MSVVFEYGELATNSFYRFAMIIVGNARVLCKQNLWNHLLHHFQVEQYNHDVIGIDNDVDTWWWSKIASTTNAINKFNDNTTIIQKKRCKQRRGYEEEAPPQSKETRH